MDKVETLEREGFILDSNISARNKDQVLVDHFLKIGCCSTENVWEIWPTKIYFDRLNAEISW